MSNVSLTPKSAYDKAKEEGLTVVVPDDNQLQLDVDDELAGYVFKGMRSVLEQRYKILDVVDRPSKSGGAKRHITLTLDKSVTPVERILLQACLGSDRKRELLSYFRVLSGVTPATLFLERAN